MHFETECVKAAQGHPKSWISVTIESRISNFLLVISNNVGPGD